MSDQHTEKIRDYLNRTTIPTFKDFVKKNKTFLVQNSSIDDKLHSKWVNLYITACRSVGVNPNTADKVDWGDVFIALVKAAKDNNDTKQQKPNPDSTTTPTANAKASSSSSNNTTSRHMLTDTEKIYVESLYQKLKEENMWTLKTGRKVEKVMEECARDYTVEQGAHSLIVDPLDSVWGNYFTEEEREEISSTNAPELPPLTLQMTEYLQKFENLTDLDDLFNKANEDYFNPKKDAELYWLKQSIINALEIYYCGFLDKEVKSESDLLHRIWRPIYLCFDHSANISVTSGEKTSYASALRKKESKTETEAPSKFFGTRTDLLFFTPITMKEFGTAEMGLKSATESNKSVNELKLKVPKTMKDMLLRLIKLSPVEPDKIITCGFNISGVYLNQLVMDNPKGYVCRVSRFPVELQYPVSPDNFIQLFKPILATIYGTRIQMESTLKHIDDERKKAGIPSYGFKKTNNSNNIPIPPCFTPIPAQRKRKNTSSNSNNSN
ncbi:hypothetical protein INT45_013338, partial [Circinella minor]